MADLLSKKYKTRDRISTGRTPNEDVLGDVDAAIASTAAIRPHLRARPRLASSVQFYTNDQAPDFKRVVDAMASRLGDDAAAAQEEIEKTAAFVDRTVRPWRVHAMAWITVGAVVHEGIHLVASAHFREDLRAYSRVQAAQLDEGATSFFADIVLLGQRMERINDSLGFKFVWDRFVAADPMHLGLLIRAYFAGEVAAVIERLKTVPTTQPTSQPASQPSSQPAMSQPASQPASQPTRGTDDKAVDKRLQ